jgi:hypothetical protein
MLCTWASVFASSTELRRPEQWSTPRLLHSRYATPPAELLYPAATSTHMAHMCDESSRHGLVIRAIPIQRLVNNCKHAHKSILLRNKDTDRRSDQSLQHHRSAGVPPAMFHSHVPAPDVPPMTARTHWLSARPTGSSVVTSTSKGAKSSDTPLQIARMDPSSSAEKAAGLPSVS